VRECSKEHIQKQFLHVDETRMTETGAREKIQNEEME
jgi:hypothetical protein